MSAPDAIARMRAVPACAECQTRRHSWNQNAAGLLAPMLALDRASAHRCDACAAIVRDAALPTGVAILGEVLLERSHQDAKWGGSVHDASHNSHDWIAILVKHVGKAVMKSWDAATFRKQMVRVAAVAVAAIEWLDLAAERGRR